MNRLPIRPGHEGMVDLEELRGEAVRLLQLLDGPHPGLSVWTGFLRQRLQNICRIADEAFADTGQPSP